MKIHCGTEVIETKCTGCPCHWNEAIVMGELRDGFCQECGCPKTKASFDRMKNEGKK